MGLPEHLEEFFVAHHLGIEHDQHHLVVPGHARTHFPVGGIGRHSPGVAHGRGVDAVELPETALRPPETTQAEHRLLHAFRVGRRQRVAVHEMRRRHLYLLLPPGQRLGCIRYLCLLADQSPEHVCLLSRGHVPASISRLLNNDMSGEGFKPGAEPGWTRAS